MTASPSPPLSAPAALLRAELASSWTVKQAAAALRKSPNGVLHDIRRGRIRALRCGHRFFIPIDEVERVILEAAPPLRP